jgi:4-carboxymuconolactone decarboxylase
MTPRIRPVDPATTTPDIQELLAVAVSKTGGADNIYGTLANFPGLMRRYLPFSTKLVLLSKLDPRERELVVLRTGWLCQSDYEWGQHARIARQAGATDEEVVRVTVGPDDPAWTPHERALLRATDEMVRDHCIGDETWAVLAERLDDRQLIELTLLIGHYVMIAGFLRTMGVEREPGVETFPDVPRPAAS